MSQVTQSLELMVGGGPASSQSLNKGEELVHPRPCRWSCARQEIHWDSNCHNTNPRKQRKVVVPASVTEMTQRWSWKNLLPFHCGQGVKPWRRWQKSPGSVFPAWSVAVGSPTMGKCLLHAQCSDVWFVVADTTVKKPGVRDWHQCKHV